MTNISNYACPHCGHIGSGHQADCHRKDLVPTFGDAGIKVRYERPAYAFAAPEDVRLWSVNFSSGHPPRSPGVCWITNERVYLTGPDGEVAQEHVFADGKRHQQDMGEALSFTYRNYRGEVEARQVRPITVYFGSTDWHPERQWLLKAFDLDRQAERDFAMKDIVPSDLHEAAHAALYAMRLVDEQSAKEISAGDCSHTIEVDEVLGLETRTALARSYACLEAALLGRLRPNFEDAESRK